MTTPLGHTTEYGYDADGRRTTMTLPGGTSTWTYGYDAAGNQTSVTDPLGDTTTSGFDEAGNLVSTTDAEDNTTGFAWDGMNRLTTVTAADGADTSYDYDQLGNLVSRTDPNGHITTFGYDAVGRLIETIDPLGRKQTTGYDADGNPVEMIGARGHEAADAGGDPAPWTLGYTYDRRGLLTAVSSADPGVASEYAYDTLGRRSEATIPGLGTEHNTVFYGYDPGSRLTSVRRGTAEFGYDYDPDGHVVSRTYPDGTVIDADFDADGRQTTSTRTTDTGVQHPPVRFSYHATGQIARIRYTNTGGAQRDELRVYDAAQRLSGVFNEDPDATDRISGYAVTRDGVGNPTSVEITGTSVVNGTRTYNYDTRNRLTGVCYTAACEAGDPAIGYAYDPVGNRTEQTRTAVPDPGTTTYTYDNADQLTETVTGSGADQVTVPYTWDADGNLVSVGDTNYEFDALNREASRTGSDGTHTTTWGPDGNRLWTQQPGAEQQAYFWDTNYADGLPRLAIQADSAGAGRRTWSYASQDGTSLDATVGVIGAELAQVLTDEGFDPTDSTDGDGGADAFAVEQATWLHHDHRKSVVNSTAYDARQVKTGYDYEPYGARDPTLTVDGSFDPLLGYTGEYHDPTGDIHLRARQYDPELGRFTATDPVMPATEAPYVSAYAYAGNKPQTHTDPTGKITAGELWEEALKVGNDVDQAIIGIPGAAADLGGAALELGRDYTLGAASGTLDTLDTLTFGKIAPLHQANKDFDQWLDCVIGQTAGRQLGELLGFPIAGAGAAAFGIGRLGTQGAGWAIKHSDDARTIAKEAAEVAAAATRGNKPRATAAAVDPRTGRAYIGQSGEKVTVPETLQSRLPEESLEEWAVTNCAEVVACSRALEAGANLDDLVVYTVKTRRGEYFPPCKNCRTWLPGVG